MNILVIAPFCPYPPDQGGKIRVFNLIKYLSRLNRITLACLSAEKVTDYGPLTDYCAEIVCVERPARTVLDLAGFLLGKTAFNSVRYASKEFRAALMQLGRDHNFDVVQVEMPMLWQYADLFPGFPVTLDAHNVEYDLVHELRKDCRNRFKRLLYGLEEERLRRLEERAWEDCRFCYTVSEHERATIASRVSDPAKIVTVPNGVDLERFIFKPERERGRRILFIGGMDWAPNLDAARYFLKDILPLIHGKIPGVSVDFIGRDLWKLRDMARSGTIRMHENIQDVVPWFHETDVLAVPLRQGAGTRIKILEAMAAGLPVVTTTKGCEGTEAVHEKHLLTADSSRGFADEVVRVLNDATLAPRLTDAARRLVEEKYSWEKAATVIHETSGILQ